MRHWSQINFTANVNVTPQNLVFQLVARLRRLHSDRVTMFAFSTPCVAKNPLMRLRDSTGGSPSKQNIIYLTTEDVRGYYIVYTTATVQT